MRRVWLRHDSSLLLEASPKSIIEILIEYVSPTWTDKNWAVNRKNIESDLDVTVTGPWQVRPEWAREGRGWRGSRVARRPQPITTRTRDPLLLW